MLAEKQQIPLQLHSQNQCWKRCPKRYCLKWPAYLQSRILSSLVSRTMLKKKKKSIKFHILSQYDNNETDYVTADLSLQNQFYLTFWLSLMSLATVETDNSKRTTVLPWCLLALAVSLLFSPLSTHTPISWDLSVFKKISSFDGAISFLHHQKPTQRQKFMPATYT